MNPQLLTTKALMMHALRPGVSRPVLTFYLVPAGFFTIVTVVAGFITLGVEPTSRTVLSGTQTIAVEVVAALGLAIVVWMLSRTRRVGSRALVDPMGKELEALVKG